MTIGDVVEIMDRKKAMTAHVAFLFSADILIHDNGVLPNTDVYWEKRDTKGVTYIYFNSKSDPSWGYRHVYADYLALASTNHYRSKSGTDYYFEFKGNRLDTYFMCITRSLTNSAPAGFLYRHLPASMQDKCVKVTYYHWDHTKSRVPWKAMIPYKFIVTSTLLEEVKTYAFRQTEGKFNAHDIYSMAVSLSKREISGGVSIRRRTTDAHLTANDLFMLAQAVYIHCYIVKYDVGRASSTIIEAVKKTRDLQKSNLAGKFKNYMEQTMGAIWNTVLVSLEDTLFFWMSFPEMFPVRFDKIVQFVDVETFVPEGSSGNKSLKGLNTVTSENIECDKNIDDLIRSDISQEAVTRKLDEMLDVISPDEVIQRMTLEKQVRLPDDQYDHQLTDYLGSYEAVGCDMADLKMEEVPGDGNCLYASLIRVAGLEVTPSQLRASMLSWYRANVAFPDAEACR